jgi:hypothetical protein
MRLPLVVGFALALLFGSPPQAKDGGDAAAPAKKEEKPALPTPDERAALKTRVDDAVGKGIAWLKRQQSKEGHWGPVPLAEFVFNEGPTALVLLALLDSGVYRGEESISRGFEWLLPREFTKVYDVSISIMAFEAKATPPEELRSRSAGGKAGAGERTLSDREREWMRRAAKWLADNRTGPAWSYPRPKAEPDNSNTQYGILGLKSAARCGIKTDREVWLEALLYFQKAQEQKGPSAKLVRGEAAADTGYAPKSYATRADVLGFGYKPRTAPGEAYGSMTCVGIASLLICESELRGYGKYTGKMAAETARGVRNGLAWLQENFAVDAHPKHGTEYHHYYLYALERAGAISNTDLLGGRDWYHEGATYLCDTQQGDGRWVPKGGHGGDLAETAFALLFLKRSTVPLGGSTPRVSER